MTALRLGTLLILLGLASGAGAQELASLTVVTETGEHPFSVEVADSPMERSRGLMYRRELAADHGMIFDFGTEQPASFWMKNTYVSLDMIFIRADGTVANVAENTEPLSVETVQSTEPVRYVLELVAGSADAIGLKAGDRVEYTPGS